MLCNTKNSCKAKTRNPAPPAATVIPSSRTGKVKKKKNNNDATAGPTQPLSTQELAILQELNKHNKASMSIIQAQKGKGMSLLPR